MSQTPSDEYETALLNAMTQTKSAIIIAAEQDNVSDATKLAVASRAIGDILARVQKERKQP